MLACQMIEAAPFSQFLYFNIGYWVSRFNYNQQPNQCKLKCNNCQMKSILFFNKFHLILFGLFVTKMKKSVTKYTETIKLCPLDVCVCQFQMYERISFKFSHYQLCSCSTDLHLKDIHLIISTAADKAVNTSTLKIKSHINSLCVRHNPEPFKHI